MDVVTGGMPLYRIAVIVAACGLGACKSDDAPRMAAASASASSSVKSPVDVYCGAVDDGWASVLQHCSPAERKTGEFSEAKQAVSEASALCRRQLGQSSGADRVSFVDKDKTAHPDRACTRTLKFEWAALGPLSRLASNCAPTRVVGEVPPGGACDHHYECAAGVCTAKEGRTTCGPRLAEGAVCEGAPRSPFDGQAVCGEDLYCDVAPQPPLLLGYPKSPHFDGRKFSITPGEVVLEPLSDEAKRSEKWKKAVHPYLLRCFEAALERTPTVEGSIVLAFTSKGDDVDVSVKGTNLPELFAHCVVASAKRVRGLIPKNVLTSVHFQAREEPLARKHAPPTGRCAKRGAVGERCETHRQCIRGLTCRDWRCQLDEPDVRTCQDDGDCWLTEFCESGLCMPAQPPGARCVHSRECLAGVCIEHACEAMCRSEHGPSFDPD